MYLFGKPIFEVKNMYGINNEYNIRNGYVVPHVPEIEPTNELGTVLFGEDPGNIIDEVFYIDHVERLTR